MKIEYEKDIKSCIECFNSNGVILYPTDTIWGIGCNAQDEVAIEKIYQIKSRDKNKSFVLLMTDVKQLSKYIANPLPDLQEIINQFEEPTTIIYPNAIMLPHSLIAADGSIAVRITNDSFCRSLIKRMREPLVSTSANISGEPSPSTFDLIANEIKSDVDYIVHWQQENKVPNSPSRILKLELDGSFTKIR